MKRLFLAGLAAPLIAFAQSWPAAKVIQDAGIRAD